MNRLFTFIDEAIVDATTPLGALNSDTFGVAFYLRNNGGNGRKPITVRNVTVTITSRISVEAWTPSFNATELLTTNSSVAVYFADSQYRTGCAQLLPTAVNDSLVVRVRRARARITCGDGDGRPRSSSWRAAARRRTGARAPPRLRW